MSGIRGVNEDGQREAGRQVAAETPPLSLLRVLDDFVQIEEQVHAGLDAGGARQHEIHHADGLGDCKLGPAFLDVAAERESVQSIETIVLPGKLDDHAAELIEHEASDCLPPDGRGVE